MRVHPVKFKRLCETGYIRNERKETEEEWHEAVKLDSWLSRGLYFRYGLNDICYFYYHSMRERTNDRMLRLHWAYTQFVIDFVYELIMDCDLVLSRRVEIESQVIEDDCALYKILTKTPRKTIRDSRQSLANKYLPRPKQGETEYLFEVGIPECRFKVPRTSINAE